MENLKNIANRYLKAAIITVVIIMLLIAGYNALIDGMSNLFTYKSPPIFNFHVYGWDLTRPTENLIVVQVNGISAKSSLGGGMGGAAGPGSVWFLATPEGKFVRFIGSRYAFGQMTYYSPNMEYYLGEDEDLEYADPDGRAYKNKDGKIVPMTYWIYKRQITKSALPWQKDQIIYKKYLHCLEPGTGKKLVWKSAVWSPDSTKVVLYETDSRQQYVLDLNTKNLEKTISGLFLYKWIDDCQIYCLDKDNNNVIYNINTKQKAMLPPALQKSGNGFNFLAYDKNTNNLYFTENRETSSPKDKLSKYLLVFDYTTLKLKDRFPVYDHGWLSPNGRYILSADSSGGVIFDIEKRQIIINKHLANLPYPSTITPGGTGMHTLSEDGFPELFEYFTGKKATEANLKKYREQANN